MELDREELLTTPEKAVFITEEERKLNDIDTPESFEDEELR